MTIMRQYIISANDFSDLEPLIDKKLYLHSKPGMSKLVFAYNGKGFPFAIRYAETYHDKTNNKLNVFTKAFKRTGNMGDSITFDEFSESTIPEVEKYLIRNI